MVIFILLATVLVIVGVALVVVPLVRPLRSQLPPARWTAFAVCALLAAGSAGLYVKLSNWHWSQSPGVDSPESMVERLIHQLNRQPDNLDGWLMLGRSYVVLQEYPLAVRAFQRADEVAHGSSAPALVGEAEAMIMIRESSLDGRAGALIERALTLDPNSPKALFFGAAAALRRGNLVLARTRFSKLLAMNPPANVQVVLKHEIAGINSKLAANATPKAAKIQKPAGR